MNTKRKFNNCNGVIIYDSFLNDIFYTRKSRDKTLMFNTALTNLNNVAMIVVAITYIML